MSSFCPLSQLLFRSATEVRFGPGVSRSRELKQWVDDRMSRWISLRRLIPFFPRVIGYVVDFDRRVEIFDLIQCRIRVEMIRKRWQGLALGSDVANSFETAFGQASYTDRMDRT